MASVPCSFARARRAAFVVRPCARIVEDYFDDADGETVIITERITADASDEGYDSRAFGRLQSQPSSDSHRDKEKSSKPAVKKSVFHSRPA
jgi:hypothetical protein